MQQAATAGLGVKLDDMEFGRRLAVEKELEKSESRFRERALWDETSTFIIYPSLSGIKSMLAADWRMYGLTLLRSRQYGHEQGLADIRQGRKQPFPGRKLVSGHG